MKTENRVRIVARGLICGVAAVLVLLDAPRRAAAEVLELDDAVQGRKVVQRGGLSAVGKRAVPVAGLGDVTIERLASVGFADHAALTDGLRRARPALLADPVEETEAVETDTATILSRTTRAVIVDPKKLKDASPELARVRGGEAKATLASLNPTTRKAFDEFYQKAKGMPPAHPMRKAADQGEQALMDAVAEGQGDIAITTTVTVPKYRLAKDSKGKVVPPQAMPSGSFVISGPSTATVLAPQTSLSTVEEDREGTAQSTAKFLTGFTEGDSWDYSRRWDFATGGYFKVKASAWYAYGLRVPFEVTGTMNPATITLDGGDKATDYEVALKANVIDGSKSFYESVGLPKEDVHDGKELVLEAGFTVKATLHVLGTDINETLPKQSAFDFSQNFRPPFGDCGTDCGFNVWIPAEITHTGINILGIVKGSARVGVNVSGEGKAALDFQGEFDGKPSQSWKKGDKKNAAMTQRVEFGRASDTRTFVCEAPASAQPLPSRKYGYTLSKPGYDWTVVLTPGVRADVSLHLWPVSGSYDIKPIWLDVAAIKLGTIKLGPHAGTKTTHAVHSGRKIVQKVGAAYTQVPAQSNAIVKPKP